MKSLLLFLLLFPLLGYGQDCDSIILKESLEFYSRPKHIYNSQKYVTQIETDSLTTRLWVIDHNGQVYLSGNLIYKTRKVDTANGKQKLTVICARKLQHFELRFDDERSLLCTPFYDEFFFPVELSFLLKGNAYINNRKLIGKNRPANIKKGDSVLARQLCASLVKQINCFDVRTYMVDSKRMDTINKKAYTIDIPTAEARKLQWAAQCLLK